MGESIKDQMVYGGSGDSGTVYNDGDIGRSELRMSSAPATSFQDLTAFGNAEGFGGYVPPSADRSQDVLLAAGDSFTMGRGPVSVGQSGRTVYISDQGSQPSIDSMLSEAQAQLGALKAATASQDEVAGAPKYLGPDGALYDTPQPPVVITGSRTTDAEGAAYDAEQAQGLLQAQNDAQVIAGSYDKFGAAWTSFMGGNWSQAWSHLNYTPSAEAKQAVYRRVFPQTNPTLARVDAAAGGPLGAALVMATQNSSAHDQYYAAQLGRSLDGTIGALGGAVAARNQVSAAFTGVQTKLAPDNVRVYRAEATAGRSQRVFIDESGNVTIPEVLVNRGRGAERTLYLGFDASRAAEFMQQRLDRGAGSSTVRAFEVPRSYLDGLRTSAVPEDRKAQFPNSPLIADPTKAPDQYGLRPAQIDSLRQSIIPGTGLQLFFDVP